MKTRTRALTDKDKLAAGEYDYFKKLLALYPEGIISVVADTFDLWSALTVTLPLLKEEILARNGKLVIRPDSGDPVDIICGKGENIFAVKSYIGGKLVGENTNLTNWSVPEQKGVIELLWDVFGGTVNEQGYKVLDPHIGAIYGDSITLERAKQSCERLMAKGFASINIVFGIGSYTYQYNTRDTFGFAMKATYGEITHECSKVEKRMECLKHNYPYSEAQVADDGSKCKSWVEPREIFKDPITDDGTKRSKKGLLCVVPDGKEPEEVNPTLVVVDQCTWEQEKMGLLTTVFLNGKLVKETTLTEIRERLSQQI
jgi:nicotinamide phosphoribosyltransferase